MKVCPKCRAIFINNTGHCTSDGTRLEETTEDPLLGTTIDRYRFDSALGSGGMGNVYRAAHVELDRQVAIKVLWGDLSANPDFVARFRREARAMSKIQHKNIVSVLDFMVLDSGLSLLVMEYVPGQTLKQRLQQTGALPASIAGRIAREIAEGLGEAHRLGFVHRDLKPANVILTGNAGEEVVKILDFGNVRVIDEDSPDGKRLTQVGLIVGTPIYMAPEQVEQDAGPAADLYALGVILFEMLSGRPPFDADRLQDLLAMHMSQPPPQIGQHGGLEGITYHLLGKRPEHRPPNAAAVVAAIDACASDAEPMLPGPPAPAPDRLWQIAANRLRSLGLDVYFAENAVRGTMRIDPSQFETLDGIGLGTDVLSYVALSHDKIGLVAPVSARGLGTFSIFEIADKDELLRQVQSRWALLIARTRDVVARARSYMRSASVRPATWTVEATVADTLGELSFRFDPTCSQLELVSVGGDVPTPDEAAAIPAIALPEDPAQFDFDIAAAPSLERLHKIHRVPHQARSELFGPEDVDKLTLFTEASEALELAVLSDRHVGPEGADPQAAERLGLEAPIQLRLPRIPCRVQATMGWSGQAIPVTIANVNASGVFVAVPADAAPEIDDIVHLRGFGNFDVSARVRHKRPIEEASVLGSEEGIGLAFMRDEVEMREGASAVVAIRDEFLRDRVVAAVRGANYRPVVADNLVAVAAALSVYDTKLVVMDDSTRMVRWHGVVAALDLVARKVPLVIVGENVDAPDWAEVIGPLDVAHRFTIPAG